jgi:hypothetical protein
MRGLVAVLLFLAAASGALAEDQIAKGPKGLSVRCTDFHKQADGTWRGSTQATLSYPTRPGSFGANTIAAHGLLINGIDLADFLAKNCARGQ